MRLFPDACTTPDKVAPEHGQMIIALVRKLPLAMGVK
jgi:hypothetical protein